jgi:hypothetical protein
MLGILVCRTPEDALVQFKIALLKQQHAEILSAVAELTKLFAGSFEEAGPQLGIARTTLARLIAKHLKTEEEKFMRPCGHAGSRHRSRLLPISRRKRVIFAWHIPPISGTGTREPFQPIGQDIPLAHAGFTPHSSG